jgi:hypothetical protein
MTVQSTSVVCLAELWLAAHWHFLSRRLCRLRQVQRKACSVCVALSCPWQVHDSPTWLHADSRRASGAGSYRAAGVPAEAGQPALPQAGLTSTRAVQLGSIGQYSCHFGWQGVLGRMRARTLARTLSPLGGNLLQSLLHAPWEPLVSLLQTSWAGPSQEVPKTPWLLIVRSSPLFAFYSQSTR